MLTRRHIRIKVMQSVYAISKAVQANAAIDVQEKFLANSIRDLHNLYVTLLSLLIAIQKTAAHQLVVSKKKYLATQEDKNPNRKFVDHTLLKMLVNNPLIEDEVKKRSIMDWDLHDEYVKIIYNNIIKSETYSAFMEAPATSFKQEKDFLIHIFKNYVAKNNELYDYIEDRKLTWVDDFPLVNTSIIRILKKSTPNVANTYFLTNLHKDEEDLLFSKALFRKTILNDEAFQDEIKGKTPNWDMERIADIDAILLKMAICEFLKFPNIPVKVTINEYLEIAKEYSTPKSSIFVNGILDKLVRDYTIENKLNKTGRGLM